MPAHILYSLWKNYRLVSQHFAFVFILLQSSRIQYFYIWSCLPYCELVSMVSMVSQAFYLGWLTSKSMLGFRIVTTDESPSFKQNLMHICETWPIFMNATQQSTQVYLMPSHFRLSIWKTVYACAVRTTLIAVPSCYVKAAQLVSWCMECCRRTPM